MTASLQATGLKKYIPILSWLPTCQSAWLRGNLLAGATTAAVCIDQMAHGGR
jgi:MFS superfamily sulfate permease-like transporter